GEPGATGACGLQAEGPHHPVLLDPERDLLLRLEAYDLAGRLPDQLAVAVAVGELHADRSLGGVPAPPGGVDLRAPVTHPGQVTHQRPHRGRRCVDLDAVLDEWFVGLAHGSDPSPAR